MEQKKKVKDLHISGDETVQAYGRLMNGAYIVNAMSLPYRKLKEKYGEHAILSKERKAGTLKIVFGDR